MSAKELLSTTSDIVIYITIGIAIISLFMNGKQASLKILKLYFIIMALFEIYAKYAAKQFGNNHFIHPIFAIFDLSIFSAFIYFILKEELKRKEFIKYFFGIFSISLVILLYNVLLPKSMDIGMTFSILPILTFCFYMFYILLEERLYYDIYIVFIVASFLTHGVSLLIFALSKTIFSLSLDHQIIIYLIRSIVLLIAKSLILFFAFKSANFSKISVYSHE